MLFPTTFISAPEKRDVGLEKQAANYTPHTIVAGYYGFTLDVCVSVRQSVVRPSIHPSIRFSFPDDNLSKRQWIFTKLGVSIDIVKIWFGIAGGQISSNFYGVICWDTPIFLFFQWIFIKLGVCIDIVEIWFGIANGQISSNFDWVICPRHAHIFVFRMITWINVKGF